MSAAAIEFHRDTDTLLERNKRISDSRERERERALSRSCARVLALSPCIANGGLIYVRNVAVFRTGGHVGFDVPVKIFFPSPSSSSHHASPFLDLPPPQSPTFLASAPRRALKHT